MKIKNREAKQFLYYYCWQSLNKGNMTYNETDAKIKYKIFENVIANRCFIHEIENDFLCTPSATDEKYSPKYIT